MKNSEHMKDKNSDKILFKRDFYLICIANFCTCMAIYSVMPVLPLYLIDVLHCKESVMGIGLAAFPLVALAVRPFSGMMSDMMDCKRLLLIATTCCAIFFPSDFYGSNDLVVYLHTFVAWHKLFHHDHFTGNDGSQFYS